MNLFQNAKFFTTVNHLKDLPDTPLEIAFVGRSNAGKSSAINTLTNHVRLAYVSKTPGRTQHINFFELQNGNFLVDLPGYGYAQVPEAIRTHWVKLLGDYLHKLSKNEQIKTLSQVKKLLKPYSERQNISVQLFSSLKKQGLEEVNQTVGSWFAATDVPLSLSVED